MFFFFLSGCVYEKSDQKNNGSIILVPLMSHVSLLDLAFFFIPFCILQGFANSVSPSVSPAAKG